MAPMAVPSTATLAGACNRAKYQMAGALRPRCGSLASKGLPLTVRVPATTQLLLPLPSGVPALRVRSSAQASMPWLTWRENMPAASCGPTLIPWGLLPAVLAGAEGVAVSR